MKYIMKRLHLILSLCLSVLARDQPKDSHDGKPLDANVGCECDHKCVLFNNCCEDEIRVCNSTSMCAAHCKSMLPDKPACQRCAFSSNPCVSDTELLRFTSSLWELNEYFPNDEDIEVNQNGEKFFVYVNEEIFEQKSFKRAAVLFDNYVKDWEVMEERPLGVRTEEMQFIRYFLKTKIGKKLYRFLRNKGLAGCGYKWEFKDILKKIWARKFKRTDSVEKCSSGFENVFVGETKEETGIGLNNWMRIYQLEKDAKIKLHKFVDSKSRPGFQMLKYDWEGSVGVTTIFVGATPQWEFAVYTLCHLVRPNRSCTIIAKDWSGNEYNVTMRSECIYKLNRHTELTHVSNIQVFH